MKHTSATRGTGRSVPTIELVLGLSQAMDLVSPAVVDHHRRVAFIAAALAEEAGLPLGERTDITLAGLVHDCGALSLRERLQTLEFELVSPDTHAEAGWMLLESFPPFAAAAVLVRHHHARWDAVGDEVPVGAHVLHLADRIDVLMSGRRDVLNQVASIRRRIRQEEGRLFMPQLVQAFQRLSENESFWLDASARAADAVVARHADFGMAPLDEAGVADLARLFSRLIDFRSRFTATHTAGVAAVAEALARAAGLGEATAGRVRVAGHLHDLGKLAIPAEILEKPARLTAAEFNVIKKHTFWSYRILEGISGLADIAGWAAYHHEKLDGQGYPFHLTAEELPTPARLMSVADVFTALAEDRPYRAGMDEAGVRKLMAFMVRRHALDPDLVDLALSRYPELAGLRVEAQRQASAMYRRFARGVNS